MLNSSPWAQTQVETDTSQLTYSPTTSGTSSIGQSTSSAAGTAAVNPGRSIQNDRADRGASNQALSVNYHVRFLSAKPIRQAFARMIELQDKNNKGVREQLAPFVDRDFKPPISDGLGAKFVFPRQVDGQPFLTETGDVRFFAQLSDKITLNTKYKLQDMVYEGKLEY
jgi:hypothetical protein